MSLELMRSAKRGPGGANSSKLWLQLPATAGEMEDQSSAMAVLSERLGTHCPNEIVLELPQGQASVGSPLVNPKLIESLVALRCPRVWLAIPGGVAGPQFSLLYDRPIGPIGWAAKRALDIAGAIFLLIFLLPLLLIVAGAIKLESPGPIIFRQRRVGYCGKLFDILKFRSMYLEGSDADGSRLTTRDDPRVTRIGRLIRRTSIDELPQLINVLKGDMSLVGPRPYPLGARAGGRLYGDVVSNIGLRHRVRPGITGLAQVSGYRGNTETEERLVGRINYDLKYIDRWSFWLDIKILLRTPLAGTFNGEAY
jgi:lipopolysaccharide/colanic/teichoic acid biosynthesis glycosyltransferase